MFPLIMVFVDLKLCNRYIHSFDQLVNFTREKYNANEEIKSIKDYSPAIRDAIKNHDWTFKIVRASWLIVLLIQSFYLWIFSPVALLFYELREGLSLFEKIKSTIKGTCCLFIFIISIYLVSVIWFTHTYIPE